MSAKVPPKGTVYGNYKRADFFEARSVRLAAALSELIAYADGMNPVPPVIYRARVVLSEES